MEVDLIGWQVNTQEAPLTLRKCQKLNSEHLIKLAKTLLILNLQHTSTADLPTPHVPLFQKNVRTNNSVAASQYGGKRGLYPDELRGERKLNYDVSTSQFGGNNPWSAKLKIPKQVN